MAFVEREIPPTVAGAMENDCDVALIAIGVDDIRCGNTFGRASGFYTHGLLDRDFVKVVSPELAEENVEEPGPRADQKHNGQDGAEKKFAVV